MRSYLLVLGSTALTACAEPPIRSDPGLPLAATSATPIRPTAPALAPTAPHAEETRPPPPRGRVWFSFDDAALPDVIRATADVTGRGMIFDSSKLRGVRVSFHPPTRLTVGEAWEAFLLILDLHGFTVVQRGAYSLVVETKGIVTQPLPVFVSR